MSGVVAADKVYDGTRTAALSGGQLANLVAGESLGVGLTGGLFDTAGVGLDKPVTGNAALTDGSGKASNYLLSNPGVATSADITPALLQYVADPVTAMQGMLPPVLTGQVSGFVAGETLATATTGTLGFATPASASSLPGSYAVDGYGLSAVNYTLAQAPGNASAMTIVPPTPTVVAANEVAILVDSLRPEPMPIPLVHARPGNDADAGRPAGHAHGSPGGRGLWQHRRRRLLVGRARGVAGRPQCLQEFGVRCGDEAARGRPRPGRPAAVHRNSRPGGWQVSRVRRVVGQGRGRTRRRRGRGCAGWHDAAATNAAEARRCADADACASGRRGAACRARAGGAQPGRHPAGAGICRTDRGGRGAAQDRGAGQGAADPDAAPRAGRRTAADPAQDRRLVGLDNYVDDRIPLLENAGRDVEAVARVLETQLGYQTVVVRDASREAIIGVLNKLALTARPNDSVVVYYAGHGTVVDETGLGYWIPASADAERPEAGSPTTTSARWWAPSVPRRWS